MVEEFRVGKMVEDVRVEKMMVEDGRVDRMVKYDGVKEKVDEAKAFESSMMGEDDQDYDYDFCVGDIVWVKTKINTRWPARIHDPADASKYGGIESDQEDSASWISGQSKARIFIKAVEKALEEFGRRVKLNMTCACVLKEDRLSVHYAASKEGVLVSNRNSSELGEFSVTRFDSAKFLAHLKNLAHLFIV
ncbi:putative non-specific serine/threonine protein kinase [Rosa chinensis]|uniref:Putative non-specific serine/threonine protein kinase n=1 Tax=Rosa chinensis TaxID=74649 RepID=A0A2P6RAU0_ROSCH|nr:putative non-specific serine/threonine protein kinase [Rosa chinensis]